MKSKKDKSKNINNQSTTDGAGQAKDADETQVVVNDFIESLTPAEIQELIKKADEADNWKNKYLYAVAELENFRKRSVKERSDLIKYAGKNILFDLLEVVDNFDRAIEADKKESDPKVIVQGIEIIYKQLLKVLENNGVKPVESKEKTFDPEVHDAIQKVHTDEAEPGKIIDELQKGYFHKDKVLRPARVVVAAEPEESEDSEQ